MAAADYGDSLYRFADVSSSGTTFQWRSEPDSRRPSPMGFGSRTDTLPVSINAIITAPLAEAAEIQCLQDWLPKAPGDFDY